MQGMNGARDSPFFFNLIDPTAILDSEKMIEEIDQQASAPTVGLWPDRSHRDQKSNLVFISFCVYLCEFFCFHVWSHELRNVGVGMVWLASASLNICSV
jgi:hypothetical protein